MTRKGKEEKRIIVSTQKISEILGLSDRRIRQLANEGMLVRIGHGKFDLPASIQRYVEVLKEQNQTDDEVNYQKERALLTKANRQKAELELKIMRGEVHRSEDVESVMNDMLSSFRAQMLVIPGKLAPQLISITDVEEIKSIIKRHIYEALQELSDYDPDMFYSVSKKSFSAGELDETVDKAEKGPRENGQKEN